MSGNTKALAQNPAEMMEPRAFLRQNDQDWRGLQDAGGNAEATQRSIAISLKRIADFCDDLRTCIREDGSFSVRP
jgi:hypothetical protein